MQIVPKLNRKSIYSSYVFHGNKAGRSIGFPTLNLDPSALPPDTKPGVYASFVYLNNPASTEKISLKTSEIEKPIQGALYFGPRLVMNETATVLEIHLLNFNQELYDQKIWFVTKDYIRDVIHFKSLEELTLQLTIDCKNVSKLLSKNKS